jgi:hypothetical protein
MTMDETHLGSPLGSAQDDRPAPRICIPIVPTLLAVLAMVNVTSVVFVLLE